MPAEGIGVKAVPIWLVVAGSLAGALLVQEYAVRLALPAFDPAGHLRFAAPVGDLPALGPRNETHRLVKNSGDYDVTVQFNRHGLRDRRDIAQATEEDIVVVGDSFAFGWGVEADERFSRVLEARTGRRVFNVSAPADIDGYEKLLDYATAQGAKIGSVVIALNMTDDLQDYDAPKPQPAAAPSATRPPGLGLRQVKEFLLGNSALYFMVTSLVQRVGWLREILVRTGLIIPLSQVSRRDIDTGVIRSTARRLAALARRFDITVLVIPNRGLWLGSQRDNESRIHDELIAALRAAGLRLIDMRPIQEKDGAPMRYHFVNDGHWRPIGHVLAGEALARQLGGNR